MIEKIEAAWRATINAVDWFFSADWSIAGDSTFLGTALAFNLAFAAWEAFKVKINFFSKATPVIIAKAVGKDLSGKHGDKLNDKHPWVCAAKC